MTRRRTTTVTDVVRQDFANVRALADMAAAHPRREYSDPEWSGCATLSEATDLAFSGWSEPRSDVLAIAGDILAQVKQSVRPMYQPYHDVSGAFVDVGAYLQGVPECMVDFVPEDTSLHSKVVTILYSCSVTAENSADSIRRRGAVIGALVEILAQLQHSTIIYAERSTADEVKQRAILSQRIMVKDAGDRMDIDAFMFAIAHPAMLRHLCFCAGMAVGFDPGCCSSTVLQRADEVSADVVIDVNTGTNIDRMLTDPVGFIIDTIKSLGIEVN